MTPQRELRRWGSWFVVAQAIFGVALFGCVADGAKEADPGVASASIEKSAWDSVTLTWGDGAGQAGLRAAETERPAEGPSSIAVAPNGSVVVLDRLNERALGVTPRGEVRSIANVAADAEHVAMGGDGAMVLWSPLRAKMWVSSKNGEAPFELAVPRALADIEHIGMGPSHRLYATNSMQETVVLGSPRAPLDLAGVLRTKREGAAFLGDGRGVVARVSKGGVGEIVTVRPAEKGQEKPTFDVAYVVQSPVSAIRLVGAFDNVVCARVSRVSQLVGGELSVEREAVCIDLDKSQVVAKREMGGGGLYSMHTDVAVGGSPPILVIAIPKGDGFHIEKVSVAAKGEVAQ